MPFFIQQRASVRLFTVQFLLRQQLQCLMVCSSSMPQLQPRPHLLDEGHQRQWLPHPPKPVSMNFFQGEQQTLHSLKCLLHLLDFVYFPKTSCHCESTKFSHVVLVINGSRQLCTGGIVHIDELRVYIQLSAAKAVETYYNLGVPRSKTHKHLFHICAIEFLVQ